MISYKRFALHHGSKRKGPTLSKQTQDKNNGVMKTKLQEVSDWRRESGDAQYGYSGPGNDASFTGWVLNPDSGVARNIYTGDVGRLADPED